MFSFVFFCVAFTILVTTNALSSPPKGWKTRPVMPELAKSNKNRGEKSNTGKREPWDPIRFIQQSSKFIPKPSFGRSDSTVVRPGDIIWKPGVSSSLNNNFRWAPLDDVVMGGVSSSMIDNETGSWKGTVSESNNGGFVGIRTTPFSNTLNFEQCTGIRLRLRGGDGRTFKAIVRDSTDFNGICWTTSFDMPRVKSFFSVFDDSEIKTTTTIKIPFKNQIPTIFAKTVPGEIFNSENIVGLQIAYSKVSVTKCEKSAKVTPE